ncbi:hypothetical protein [Schaalia vaccimaxillae]|uniref:hypothetical protein n=1 Tax=Schaalia vaccimaxillae TaxID=183916 RepID=UPI0003B6E971|nr:hypothetical protein [Schaalia vaccimaxillae]
MKFHIDWPLFIAALNLLASVAAFVLHMLTHLHPWPSNAVLLVWMLFAILAYAVVWATREDAS